MRRQQGEWHRQKDYAQSDMLKYTNYGYKTKFKARKYVLRKLEAKADKDKAAVAVVQQAPPPQEQGGDGPGSHRLARLGSS